MLGNFPNFLHTKKQSFFSATKTGVFIEMRILFVCKHNRFRSRVASAYYNQLKKGNKNKAIGAGIYPNNDPLDKNEVEISKDFGIDIKGEPRKLNEKMLKWSDLTIIVADDVKLSQIKNHEKYKIVVWKINDTDIGNKKEIKKIIKKIINRVNSLNKRLKKEVINK